MHGIRISWSRKQSFPTWFVLLPLILAVAPCTAVAGDEGPPTPDCVCLPVEGTGYIVSYGDEMEEDGLRIPIGALSPLVVGDSLIVETGTITVVDFRNGETSVYGARTRLKIQEVVGPTQPSWWESLVDKIIGGMSDPERLRLGGAVRRGRAAFWPDGGRFAPDVPIVFEWWRVRPAPASLQILVGEELTELSVSQNEPGSGALTWRPPETAASKTISWSLLGADGTTLGGGEFVVLTTEETVAERSRFRKVASSIESMPQDLAAAVLAAADRAYLW